VQESRVHPIRAFRKDADFRASLHDPLRGAVYLMWNKEEKTKMLSRIYGGKRTDGESDAVRKSKERVLKKDGHRKICQNQLST